MGHRTNQPHTSRDFFFTPAGGNTLSGHSTESPVEDPQTAIDRVNALDPPVTTFNRASITASVTGAYTVGITLPRFTSANCSLASIRTADLLAIECLGDHNVVWGSLASTTPFGKCLKIDGKQRVRAVINSCSVPEDGIGFELLGSCDEIFIELVEGILSGERATMFFHNTTSPTPILYGIGDTIFTGIDQTFMDYDPGQASTETIMNFSAAQPAAGATVATTPGSTMFMVKSGILVVNAGVLVAECVTQVEAGALIVIDAQALAGSTIVEVGGTAVHKSLGTLLGSVEVLGAGGVAEVQTETMTGDIIVSGGGLATLKTDALTGDINIEPGGRLFCIIDGHIGTITPSNPSDGRINGVIAGVRYGNWQNRRKTEPLLDAASFVNQSPLVLDTPLQIEFGPAQNTGTDPVMIDALGKVTFNETGQYVMTLDLQYGRSGAGSVSWLFYHIEINGVAMGSSRLTKLDNANADTPAEFIRTVDVDAADVMTVFITRDSQGNNSGGLFSEAPTLPLPSAPSAMIVIERSLLQ